MTRRDKKVKLASPFPIRLFKDDYTFLSGGGYGDLTEFVRNSVHMQVLQMRGNTNIRSISKKEKTDGGGRCQGCRAGDALTQALPRETLPQKAD
jgi:hypothetical protein